MAHQSTSLCSVADQSNLFRRKEKDHGVFSCRLLVRDWIFESSRGHAAGQHRCQTVEQGVDPLIHLDLLSSSSRKKEMYRMLILRLHGRH